jgi:mRNA interferase MazF
MMTPRRTAKPSGWYPRRGEICLFALDKQRPALVISSNALNIHSLDVCVVPISIAEHKAFSLRPKLKAGEGGLDKDSWVKCDHITTIEKNKAVYPPLGSLAEGSLAKVEETIKRALELP